jgi:hypothetical protein
VPEILGQIEYIYIYIFKLPKKILNVSTHSRCSLNATLEALGNIRGIILTNPN